MTSLGKAVVSKNSKIKKTQDTQLKTMLNKTNICYGNVEANYITSMPDAKIKSKNRKIIDTTAGLSNQMNEELMLMNSYSKEYDMDNNETNNADKIDFNSGKKLGKVKGSQPESITSKRPEILNSIITSADVPPNGSVSTTVLQCNTLWMQIQNNMKKEQKQNRKKLIFM